MRVAIVAEHVDTRRGGAETSVTEMAACLARLGATVTIISADASRGAPSQPSEPPATTASDSPHVLRMRAVGLTKAARTRAFIEAADAHCAATGYDVVHAVTPCRTATVYQPRGGTYAETVRRSVAMVASSAARWVKHFGRRLNRRQRFLLSLERQLLTRPRPPFVAAVSDYVRRQVLDEFDYEPADRVRVVFNAVDFNPLAPSEAEEARRRIRESLGIDEQVGVTAFAAHNFRLKGLAELIRAAANPQSSWEVIVAGRDRQARYRALAARCGVARRIHFVGADLPIAHVLAASDLLAHPTWYDPCSRVVLEAMCAGLPVVTTRDNGAAEVVRDGVTGAVIESPAGTESLAAAVEHCLRPTIRDAARADVGKAREMLSMMRHARELLDLYREAARLK